MNFYANSNTQIKWDTYKYFSKNMNNDNVQKKSKSGKSGMNFIQRANIYIFKNAVLQKE